MRRARLAVGVGLGLLLGAAPRSAHAFEREWHLGAGAGVAGGNGLELSPAVGAYAAYGLSDAFDARVELSARGYHVGSEHDPNALSAMAGLAYKLDVLRWVPWASVYAGYLALLDAPRQALPFRRHDAALGFGFGMDYGISRQLGLGASVRFDDALGHAGASTFEALLRAEYRWGW